MTELAVVILNYNGKKFLEQFLPTVIAHSQGAVIVVADNGSSDDSVDFIRSSFPSVQLITIQRNLGFCGGYNFALKQVSATYYVLLNSDVEVTSGWLQPVVSLFKSNPNIAAIQDFGEGEGELYYVMEFCGGGDLHRRRCTGRTGRLDRDQRTVVP